MLEGTNVTLEEMMNCRERRATLQQEYKETYHVPVLSFCMNIPGPVKTNSAIHALFEDGKEQILSAFSNHHLQILEQKDFHDSTGDELLLCTNTDAQFLKELMTNIEETHPLGRLFDIDIIDENGNKLSRPVYRKCLICNKQAQECARARTHSVKEMQDMIQKLLEQYHYV